MEGCGKRSSLVQHKYRIPKKISETQSDDVHAQSPLSRLADAHQWDNPLQGWTSRSQNKFHPNWKRKRHSEKYGFSDEESGYGQPKVILTNVLKTEVGRKYTQTQLITDANLSHGVKLQSDQQTASSVDTVEIWQIFSPLHESLFISKRQPKVMLTNVLRTKTGRKYMQKDLLTDANLSDAVKPQSGEQASSSIASLDSCKKISSQQRHILSKRYERYRRKPNNQNHSKDAESNNALFTLRRCDVVLEDCSVKNKGNWPVKGRRDSKSLCLREASFQNNESRKRRSDTFPNQQNAYSSPPSKEERRDQIQSSVCKDLNKNHMNNSQQENNPKPVELDSTEKITSKQDIHVNSPDENSSNSSSSRCQHSITRKHKEVSPVTNSPRKKKVNITLAPEEPLNEPEKNKDTIDSADPIVLSSDEEGCAEAKQPVYLPTGKGHTPLKKESEQESELPLSEELSEGVSGGKTEQVSDEPLKHQPSTDYSTSSEMMDLALDIEFEKVFFGRYKGKATGCARFTPGYGKIPFEVDPGKKMELSLDLLHLRRFGLWMNSDLGSETILFLWLSSGYIEQMEKERGTSILNKQDKNTEFIFILMHEPLSEEEFVTLNKIIFEVSKKNMSPELTESLLWEQAVKEISWEENYFMNYCYQTFQLQLPKDNASILTEQPSQQETKAIIAKPNYTLLQKQSSGLYSFSISSSKMNKWKELTENGPIKNLIIYPPPPAKGGLGVTREDLECLEYGEYLNDVIIDFYLRYLLEKAPKELADRSHIFSSFFYKCLTRTEKNSEEDPSLSIAQRRHRGVKRWTRYVNIFSKDYIFVPVNEESHWYIAIICFPWLEEVIYEDSPDQQLLQSNFQKAPHETEIKIDIVRTESVLVFKDTWSDKEEPGINSNLPANDVQPATVSPGLDSSIPKSSSSNSKIKKICKRPCIIILDSLKASSSRNTVQVLREYLEAEWEAKCKTHREFSKSSMVAFYPRVPKQDNNSDCGVYLLQYVETFFQNPVVNFEFPMHLERWFPRQLVRSKREEIRDLILQLHLQQQRGSKS